MPEKDLKKGVFSKVGLPLAKTYVHPHKRNRLLLIGAAAGLVVAGTLFADIWLQSNRLVSSGPLSSSHANFENDCQSCHTGFSSVEDKKCSVCHEKYGADPALHSFDAHYIYRSNDFTRAHRRDGETPCIGCHTEHGGRKASIVDLGDDKCLDCHSFSPFEQRHPEFDFAADSIADHDKLRFTHIRHVQNVRKDYLIDDLEAACLVCHQARADGKSFQAIDFERHCTSCHLGVSQRVRSANLPVRDSGRPLLDASGGRSVLNLGVETPEDIRRRRVPGQQRVQEASPVDFRRRGDDVMKMRVRHEDPWILHNLRALRQALYPSEGLADLLRASADVPPHEAQVLYAEALETIEEYLWGLRGQAEEGELEKEIVELERLMLAAKKRIEDPHTALDDSQFLLSGGLNPRLSPGQVQQIEAFAETLTTPCWQCHQVDQATIARVQKDQRVLRRAEFDHRAHIVQRRCLDCHTQIPFLDAIGPLAASEKPPSEDQGIDASRIQNIPSITTCSECHRSGLVSNSCVTCHRFHPDQGDRAHLLMHLTPVEEDSAKGPGGGS